MFSRHRRRKQEFRPSLATEGGALESRTLMSVAAFRALRQAPMLQRNLGPGLRQPPAAWRNLVLPDNNHRLTKEGLPTSPRNYVQTNVANGGRAAVMVDTDGEIFVAHITGNGTVRARAVPGGKVDLFLYGTNVDTILTIDPELPTTSVGDAHQFATGTVIQDGLLHIRDINVVNGRVGSLLGYRTADLSGNISVIAPRGPQSDVNRIAFFNILPGASINVGADLDTLDVYNSMYLDGGPGIQAGRDLNFISVGQSAVLINGASIVSGRDLGPFDQPAKGTGPAGRGMLIQGDLVVGPGSSIAASRYNFGPIIVRGELFGQENLPPATLDVTYLQRDGMVTPAVSS